MNFERKASKELFENQLHIRPRASSESEPAHAIPDSHPGVPHIAVEAAAIRRVHSSLATRFALLLVAVFTLALAPRTAWPQVEADPAVERAIAAGTKFLLSKQRKDGSWPALNLGHKYPVGQPALVCYALLESGLSPQHPRMVKALEWLSNQKTTKTYALAMRCSAWEAANRTTQGEYRGHLARDARQLWLSGRRGSYHYESNRKPRSGWDNSNTQFGLLGVWAAARNSVEVPRQYWQSAMKHWVRTQFDDGTWGYRGDRKTSRATMTVGGIASLFVCFDQVYFAQFLRCRGGMHYPPLERGLAWLDNHFPRTVRGGPNYYYYYGVERVGLASGYKYFGKADWYKLIKTKLLKAQRPNGAWPGQWNSQLVSTAFALLFLIRGRNAVIFNKLEYDGYWNNRPRDMAMLTRWMSRTFERTVNWQVINMRVPVREWHDAPILYISGSKKPEFSDEDLRKLRSFVLQGGSILSVTECGGLAFRQGMQQTYEKLFPDYEWTEVPREHDLYSRAVHFDLPNGRPKLYVISNGVRPLVLHTDVDLSLSWQLRRWVTHRWAFHAAANVAKYLTGSVATLRHRGTTHWVEAPTFTPEKTVRLARLQHSGNWDPEPLAYTRFARMLGRDTRIKLQVLSPTSIEDLADSGAEIATLTGVGDLSVSENELQALREYVLGGGTLVVDAAGGDRQFSRAARDVLGEAFPREFMRLLASRCGIYTVRGNELRKVKYRRIADRRLGGIQEPRLKGILVDGRPAVLFSREDITAGLLGYPSFAIDGYAPQSAYDILRNAVLHVADHPPAE